MLQDQARRAKQVCGKCPVIDEFREWAFVTRQQHGVWAGMDASHRMRLVRQRERRGSAAVRLDRADEIWRAFRDVLDPGA